MQQGMCKKIQKQANKKDKLKAIHSVTRKKFYEIDNCPEPDQVFELLLCMGQCTYVLSPSPVSLSLSVVKYPACGELKSLFSPTRSS